MEKRGNAEVAMLDLKTNQVGSLLQLIDARAWESQHLVTGAPTRRLRRPNTALYHSQSISRLVKSWPGLITMNVEDVTESDLARWHTRFRNKFSPDTCNGALVVLRAAFQTALRRRLISVDPTESLQRMEIPERSWELPNAAQWEKAVEAMQEKAARGIRTASRHQVYLALWLSATGMRPTAAAALKIGDVDFQASTVHLAGEYAKNHRTAILPIGQKALGYARQAAGSRRKEDQLFLCVSARHALIAASRGAGMKINHSTLRKLFATRALEAGVAPAIAARLLTHQDGGQTLLKHYAQWRDAALVDAIQRMETESSPQITRL